MQIFPELKNFQNSYFLYLQARLTDNTSESGLNVILYAAKLVQSAEDGLIKGLSIHHTFQFDYILNSYVLSMCFARYH